MYTEELQKIFKGDIATDSATLDKASRDASLFEMRPQMVVYPKDSADVQALVKWVAEKKKDDPTLSITVRAAGTDMSGGALGESIIMDTTRYMQGVLRVNAEDKCATVLPGTYYRDFDVETKKVGLIMPAYTASRDLCTVGGMVANNSGGEKSIFYGKTEQYIRELKVVFRDG
jgi:FAD/FMN-containing dehydrogenase